MSLTVFEIEVVAHLVDDYDVDEGDATIAVEQASKEGFFKEADLDKPEISAEKVYDDGRFWDHLND